MMIEGDDMDDGDDDIDDDGIIMINVGVCGTFTGSPFEFKSGTFPE